MLLWAIAFVILGLGGVCGDASWNKGWVISGHVPTSDAMYCYDTQCGKDCLNEYRGLLPCTIEEPCAAMIGRRDETSSNCNRCFQLRDVKLADDPSERRPGAVVRIVESLDHKYYDMQSQNWRYFFEGTYLWHPAYVDIFITWAGIEDTCFNIRHDCDPGEDYCNWPLLPELCLTEDHYDWICDSDESGLRVHGDAYCTLDDCLPTNQIEYVEIDCGSGQTISSTAEPLTTSLTTASTTTTTNTVTTAPIASSTVDAQISHSPSWDLTGLEKGENIVPHAFYKAGSEQCNPTEECLHEPSWHDIYAPCGLEGEAPCAGAIHSTQPQELVNLCGKCFEITSEIVPETLITIQVVVQEIVGATRASVGVGQPGWRRLCPFLCENDSDGDPNVCVMDVASCPGGKGRQPGVSNETICASSGIPGSWAAGHQQMIVKAVECASPPAR